jgi:methylenetetrahydrofolate--tRNA-(uracil-5-)-methyltransferase
MTMGRVLVVGAGLAGSEAAWFLANKNIQVLLVESKRVAKNPAQSSDYCAELVCTNSLKSLKPDTGHGLLKMEMTALNSLVLEVAQRHQVAAGDALAVDREQFSREITEMLSQHPNIELRDEVVVDPVKYAEQNQCDYTIVATGPLTHKSLEEWMVAHLAREDFYFYDAIAPIVDAHSLNYDKLFYMNRHADPSESGGDYLNAPFNKDEYHNFIAELVKAETVPAKNFEEPKFFESCLPIDVMAARGPDTARFSCLKPIGLVDPKTGRSPYAAVQLRKENLLGDAFNLVGLQTRLTYKEQLRVFRMIPGLEAAQFLKLGSVHRNSFLNAKALLNGDLSCKKFPQLHFAGQITGVEGYTESAMTGLYVAWQIVRKFQKTPPMIWSPQTATGALINYLMTSSKPSPSSIHFGLFPAVDTKIPAPRGMKSRERKQYRRKMIVEAAQAALARTV